MRTFLHKVRQYFIPSHHNAYRPYILKKQWLIFFLTVVLTAEGVLVAGTVLKQTGVDFLAAVVPGEIIAFTNVERVQASVDMVEESVDLSSAAQAKAEDMAAKGYFAHVGPDGKEPWAWIQEAGYEYVYAGENLAVRFSESQEVVEAWMDSPTHRANIVKKNYTQIGIGVADGLYEGRPATFVVQYFGTPRVASAATIAVVPLENVAEEEEVVVENEESVVQGVTTEVPPATLTPAVAGAEGALQTYLRSFFEALMQADTAALWLLGGVALLLVVALALAFFIHLQVQPTDMLMGGATVAVIAVSLLALNAYHVPAVPYGSQSASVSTLLQDGVIGEGVMFTEQEY